MRAQKKAVPRLMPGMLEPRTSGRKRPDKRRVCSTGVADGDYRLVATTNQKQLVQEDRYYDNSVVVGVHLGGTRSIRYRSSGAGGSRWVAWRVRRPPLSPGAQTVSTWLTPNSPCTWSER